MQIIQRVTVMQVLTENSKKLLASFEERKEILERECNQLYFQLRKHEKEHHNPAATESFKKKLKNDRTRLK